MKLNKRELTLIALLGVAVAGTVFYLYFWQPLATERAALDLKRQEMSKEIERLAPWETQEAALKARIADLTAQIQVATAERELGIPLPEFLVMLENAARMTLVRLERTSLAISDLGATATLQLTGSYPALYRLLTLLDAKDGALVLDAARFSGGEEPLSATLQVRLFSGAVIGEVKVGGFPERSPFVPRGN